MDQVWAEIVYMYKQNQNVYLELTPQENLELTNIQQQFKTYREDDIYDDLREILSRKYKLNDKGEFANKESFLDQTKMVEPSDGKYIEKLPKVFLTYYMQNVHKTTRNNNNIKNALSDIIDGERDTERKFKHCIKYNKNGLNSASLKFYSIVKQKLGRNWISLIDNFEIPDEFIN